MTERIYEVERFEGLMIRMSRTTGDVTVVRDHLILPPGLRRQEGDYLWGSPKKDGGLPRYIDFPHRQWLSGRMVRDLLEGRSVHRKGSTYRPVEFYWVEVEVEGRPRFFCPKRILAKGEEAIKRFLEAKGSPSASSP